eukprot:6472275-Amphidinium_carterae.2
MVVPRKTRSDYSCTVDIAGAKVCRPLIRAIQQSHGQGEHMQRAQTKISFAEAFPAPRIIARTSEALAGLSGVSKHFPSLDYMLSGFGQKLSQNRASFCTSFRCETGLPSNFCTPRLPPPV